MCPIDDLDQRLLQAAQTDAHIVERVKRAALAAPDVPRRRPIRAVPVALALLCALDVNKAALSGVLTMPRNRGHHILPVGE